MRDIWRIIRFTSSLKRYYIAISIMTVLLAAMSQLVPLLTKGAIDEITRGLSSGRTDTGLVALFAVLIFIADAGQTIFSNIGGYWGDILSIKLKRFLSLRYYEHLMRLPQRYYDTELTGTIINRMNRGIQDIGDFAQMLSNNFLQFIFSTVFTLGIVAYYSWPVALMLLALYPIFIWMTAKTSGKWQYYQKRINRRLDIASGRFAESVGQIRVVKSFVSEDRELKYFDRYFAKAVNLVKPQSRYWHSRDNHRRLVLSVIFLAVFLFIFVQTARGVYSLGTMVLLIQYSMLIRIPLFSISFLVDRTQRAIANSRDYFDVMAQEPAIADRPDASSLEVKRGQVTFDHVSFGYEPSQSVINDISFEIEPDTKAALVGESGVGKTTLVNLLLRLYEPAAGRILIDGQDINSVTQASLRSGIAVVFQDAALFSGTIRENIAYGRPDAGEDDVVRAAKAANAHEFIQTFEKGYDTEIGERGLKLSGGQKQRIAIARALLKDAPILILDEATSNLDSRSESLVQQALEHLMEGRTVIIIAHRLSTISQVDTIITLREGRVDEIGSPAKLATSGGIYSRLLELQSSKPTETIKKRLHKFDIEA